jgi:hypothetical protein
MEALMTDQEFVTRSIRIPAEIAAQVERLATEDRRSFNNYVQIVLEAHIGQQAEDTKPDNRRAKASA